MPLNKIDITFTVPQETAIGTAITDLNTNFPFAQNLTNDEKKQYPTTDNARLPYVQRTVEIHAVNNPSFVSGFAGTLLNAQNDWKLFNQCENFKQQLLSYVEKLTETQDVAGAELYQFMLELYRMAKAAAANNVPGAQAVVDDLAPLFEGQGTKPDTI
jgi:hypothetical protein